MEGGDPHARRPVPWLPATLKPGWRPSHAWAACRSTTPRLPRCAYVDDPSADVRKQTVSSFSQRSTLLTDEMLFKRLHDSDAIIREMASLILKTRGLSQEQISLGGLIYSPKPEQRVSVIPLLKDRTDVDPVIWLIQLSRDPVEMVRIELDRGAGQAQVADRAAAAGRDGPLRWLGSRAPGGQQGRPVCAGDDRGTAPPARLVEPQSQGELTRVGQAFSLTSSVG